MVFGGKPLSTPFECFVKDYGAELLVGFSVCGLAVIFYILADNKFGESAWYAQVFAIGIVVLSGVVGLVAYYYRDRPLPTLGRRSPFTPVRGGFKFLRKQNLDGGRSLADTARFDTSLSNRMSGRVFGGSSSPDMQEPEDLDGGGCGCPSAAKQLNVANLFD